MNTELKKLRAKIFAVEKVMGQLGEGEIYDRLHDAIFSDQWEQSTHDEQRDEIAALKKRVAELETAQFWCVEGEESTEDLQDDLEGMSFDPGYHFVRTHAGRWVGTEFYVWYVADWNNDEDESKSELKGPFKTEAEARAALAEASKPQQEEKPSC